MNTQDYFVAGPSAIHSKDGTNWTDTGTSLGGEQSDVAYGNKKFVFVSGGTIKYTTDAVNWNTANITLNKAS